MRQDILETIAQTTDADEKEYFYNLLETADFSEDYEELDRYQRQCEHEIYYGADDDAELFQ